MWPSGQVLARVAIQRGCQGVTLNRVSIVDQGCAGMLVPGGAALAAGGKMMSWSWLDIPPVVLVCCWAGIRLWRVLARRDAEFKAEHAGVAAQAVAVPVVLQPAPAAAYGAGHLACAELLNAPDRGNPDSRSAG